MGPGHSETYADAHIILNKLNVTLAKRQGLLASLVGVTSKDEPKQKPWLEVSQQDEDSFSADPELLGLGGKVPDNDRVDRSRMSSNDELKRQLLGRDYDKKQKVKHSSKASQSATLTQGITANWRGPQSQQLRKAEEDSEEDAGRSSLGKRKRVKSFEAEDPVLKNGEVETQGKMQAIVDDNSQLASISHTETITNETSTGQSLHERRKKKKSKKKKKKKDKHREL